MMFELIFQGLADNSPEALVKLRGIFVADLDFPVEQARLIFESAPTVIRSAAKEEELQAISKKLQAAGAQVLIVRKVDLSQSEQEQSCEDSSETTEIEIIPAVEQISEFSLNIDFDDIQKTIDNTKPDTTYIGEGGEENVYYLDLTEAKDISAIQAELETEEGLPEKVTDHTAIGEGPDSDNALSFTLESSTPQDTAPTTTTDPETETTTDPEAAKPESELEFSLTLEPLDSTTKQNDTSDNLTEEVCKPAPTFDLEIKFDDPTAEESAPEENKDTEIIPVSTEQSNSQIALSNQEPSAPDTQPAVVFDSPPTPTNESLEKPAEKKSVTPTPSELPSEVKTVSESQNSDQPHSTTSKTAVKKKGSFLSEYIVPAGIGIVVLGLANWFYFSSQPDNTTLPTTASEQVQESKKEPKPIQKKKVKAAPKIKPMQTQPVKLSGKTETTDLQIKFDAVVIPIQQMVISLELITSEPPELTPEDIVHNRPRAPWIYSIPIIDWRLALSTTGEFAGEQPVRVYIERWNRRDRILATINLSGRYNATDKSITAKIWVKRDTDQYATNPPVLVDCDNYENCRLWVEGSIRSSE